MNNQYDECEGEVFMLSFIIEIVVYVMVFTIVLMIIPSFLIYPGIYMGRCKTTGPVFKLETKDKANIEGMILEPKNPETCDITFIFFHGNSGNMGSRKDLILDLNNTFNSYVVTIDYRGFGNNYGFPSETGLINDAESIFECVMNDKRLKDTKKIVYGRSLGSSVAIALAGKVKGIDGLVIENAFTSTKDMMVNIPYLKKIPNFIMDVGTYINSWDSRKKIEDIDIPILYMSELKKDRIVHPKMMKELYDICKSKNKILSEGDNYQDNLKKLIKLL